jgi:hypothetical protein
VERATPMVIPETMELPDIKSNPCRASALIRAKLNAFIADEHRRPRDELADLVLALPAERAIESVLWIAAYDLAHLCLPSTSVTT